MKVLSTKVLSPDIIAEAKENSVFLDCRNFIQIEFRSFSLHEFKSLSFDSVAFTSSNSVKSFMKNDFSLRWLEGKNVFSLSGKTTDELLAHQIIPMATAQSSEKLADEIIQIKSVRSVLHPCSNLRLNILEHRLADKNLTYYPLVVYDTFLVSGPPLREKFDAILFFSPSAVESFSSVNELHSRTIYGCIGSTTAAALQRKKGGLKILTSEIPEPQYMINMVCKYINSNKR